MHSIMSDEKRDRSLLGPCPLDGALKAVRIPVYEALRWDNTATPHIRAQIAALRLFQQSQTVRLLMGMALTRFFCLDFFLRRIIGNRSNTVFRCIQSYQHRI